MCASVPVLLTYDGVVVEESIIAGTAADFEDEFANVQQVVSTHFQLQPHTHMGSDSLSV